MTYDIFVSYAHADNADGFISAFIDALKKKHEAATSSALRVFFDTAEIKTMDDWEHKIFHALRDSQGERTLRIQI